ncbi:unnamed protein product, partial [Rhizoctonia solani]
MALLLNSHPRWGLAIEYYPKIYTRDAISAHFCTSLDGNVSWRTSAIATISDICKLGQTTQANSIQRISSGITLEKLKDLLELTRFPSDFTNFALPSLVEGSITLMSSLEPTPFSYEYGYLCFRILVFSLNACLIDHGYTLEFTIERMTNAPPGTHLDLFWGGAADLICAELSPMVLGFEQRLTHILNPSPDQPPALQHPKLTMLF